MAEQRDFGIPDFIIDPMHHSVKSIAREIALHPDHRVVAVGRDPYSGMIKTEIPGDAEKIKATMPHFVEFHAPIAPDVIGPYRAPMTVTARRYQA